MSLLIRVWVVLEQLNDANWIHESTLEVTLLNKTLSLAHLFASTARGNGVPDVLYGSRNAQTVETIMANWTTRAKIYDQLLSWRND